MKFPKKVIFPIKSIRYNFFIAQHISKKKFQRGETMPNNVEKNQLWPRDHQLQTQKEFCRRIL